MVNGLAGDIVTHLVLDLHTTPSGRVAPRSMTNSTPGNNLQAQVPRACDCW